MVKRKTQKFKVEWMGKTVAFEVRELLAMLFGFITCLALIAAGDLETGKAIALALIFFGIGRSTK